MKILRTGVFVTLSFLWCVVRADPGFSASDFEAVIDEVVELYTEELSQVGETITVNKDWLSDTKNASVARAPGRVFLTVYGGLARAPGITLEGLAKVICHEIGHLIGGAPRVKPTNKFSSEGQSDYFATHRCLKKFFAQPHRFNALDGSRVTAVMNQLCQTSFASGAPEFNICLHSMLAAESYKNFLIELGHGKPGTVGLDRRDSAVAEWTRYNGYPGLQCRVDTMVSGALNWPRPACWYRSDQNVDETPYIENYRYLEGLFIGRIGQITSIPFGCEIDVEELTYFRSSVVAPLEDVEIFKRGLTVIGACPYEVGEELSGTATLFESRIYVNLESMDK